MKRALITGSAGHLGRSLMEAFKAAGYKVVGLDVRDADIIADLDSAGETLRDVETFEAVVCNAKCKTWESHHALALKATESVTNISSIYGVLGNDPGMYEGTNIPPTPAWYAASKGALVSLTRWQATNLAPVRSNAVCPGGIFRLHEDNFRERYEKKVPLKRMATEADIVPLVLFLADPVKAAYITGQIIMVDGGLSARA